MRPGHYEPGGGVDLGGAPLVPMRPPVPISITLNGVDVATLRLIPGDVLALKVDDRVPADLATRTRDLLQAMLPAGVHAFVLPEGVDPIVIRQMAYGDPEVY